MKSFSCCQGKIVLLSIAFLLCLGAIARAAGPEESARQILDATGVKGGLIVHLGCGDGKLTAALHANDSYLVQGLTTDVGALAQARTNIQALGCYGPVSADAWDGATLPYIDNLVNLVIAEEPAQPSQDELLRVLAPGGTAYVKKSGQWEKIVKPRPTDIDEWTHYMHDPSNNAVAHDTVVGPPRRMQWDAGPRTGRHHDHMSSLNAAVTAGGRVFYIIDEGSRSSILTTPKWSLIGRDAFNGVQLWKRDIAKWHTTAWPLKSGPAQMPRRLVAVGERVYTTLAIDAPVSALDVATGKTIREYEGTAGTEEILSSDGVLFLLVYHNLAKLNEASETKPKKEGFGRVFYNEAPRQLMAVSADSGKTLWTADSRILPLTLTVAGDSVYFHDGEKIVCLDRANGKERWHSEAIARAEQIDADYAPTLVVYKDVVLFTGGKKTNKQALGSDTRTGIQDVMSALSTSDGKKLWDAPHPASGYRSPEDLFVIRDQVWCGETTFPNLSGIVTGRDLHTGKVNVEFPPDVDANWFHHRCYRGKATDNFMLISRTGVEFVDIAAKHWNVNHWVRGACLYGVMPANGLLYAPPHPCACYPEAKLFGFNALAPASKGPRIPEAAAKAERLEKGPAYEMAKAEGQRTNEADWPTYRHDTKRSGRTSAEVPAEVKKAWEVRLGGRLTAPVFAGGKTFVASIDTHTLYALSAEDGKKAWHFVAGGRIDSPPTIFQGRAIFGSADGYVYCLRAADGALAWRFRAAPMDQRHFYFEQIESVWPISGSVLIENGAVCGVAGRDVFLDGGLRLLRLNPTTGKLISETVMDENGDGPGKDVMAFHKGLNMPVGMPDILSGDDKHIYMHSQLFDTQGKRAPLAVQERAVAALDKNDEALHLFAPMGFLDDNYWHRNYMVYGRQFSGGAGGYYLAGRTQPAGKILVFDDEQVYGFGRNPQYYRWTTPIEHQLWAADKTGKAQDNPLLFPAAAAKAGKKEGQVKGVGKKAGGKKAGGKKAGGKKAGADMRSDSYSFLVNRHWQEPLPFIARGLVLAGDVLFAAGPPDLVDEEQAWSTIDEPSTQQALADQDASLRGAKGATLWAVARDGGKKLHELKLDSPPIFDGLIAVKGQLYMSTVDGKIVCLRGTGKNSH